VLVVLNRIAISEGSMRKRVLYIVLLTSVAIILAVIGVTRYAWPMSITFPAVILVFSLLAYLFLWRNGERRVATSSGSSNKSKSALKWLFVPFVLGAIGALISALMEGWNVGDTIGACVFAVLSLLVISKLIRRKGNVHTL
jgi:hypothetical protein